MDKTSETSLLKAPQEFSEGDDLNSLFPFHLSFDEFLRVLRCGTSLLKIEPNLVPGASLLDFFTIKNPRIPMCYQSIFERSHALHNWLLNGRLNLRGQIVVSQHLDSLVFVGSPSISSVKQLKELGLTASDFAQHDSTLDHLFMLQAQATIVSDSERMVASLQQSIEENTKLEALQAELAFELDIANDLKVRFKENGFILDFKASSALPNILDQQAYIGKDVYSQFDFLGESLHTAASSVAASNAIVKFRFEVDNNGEKHYFDARLARTLHQNYLLLANDVTKQYKLHLQLEKRANYDSLTNLLNRSYFFERIESLTGQPSDSAALYTFMIIDLDDFKAINDTYGHLAGDFALQRISQVLRNNTHNDDVVSRLGGDEFAIFFPETVSKEQMIKVAQQIIKDCEELIEFQNNEFHCGCSIGIAFVKGEAFSLELFRKQADLAMYHAKRSGKDTYAIYQEGMYERYQQMLVLRDELLIAIRDDQLSLAYQPVVNNETGKISGFEALARWHHPTKGSVSPESFIKVAEDHGLMVILGKMLLRRAMSTWSEIMQNNPDKQWTIALNISAYQLYDNALVQDLTDFLALYALQAEQIVLEITETALIRDIDQAIILMTELKKLGFTIALDDFGTGYSSLSYLDQLPLDVIKIDRSFIYRIDQLREDAPMVKSIIGIAKAMNLKVLAEGIETPLQQQFLTDLGCHYSQGFLHGTAIDEQTMLNDGKPLDEKALLPGLS